MVHPQFPTFQKIPSHQGDRSFSHLDVRDSKETNVSRNVAGCDFVSNWFHATGCVSVQATLLIMGVMKSRPVIFPTYIQLTITRYENS